MAAPATEPGGPRVLVLRQLGLGDLLASVPALRGLRTALPGHVVSLACPAPIGALLREADVVDDVVATGELRPVPWQGPPPHVGIDLHGNGPASRRLVEALRPQRLVGFWSPQLAAWESSPRSGTNGRSGTPRRRYPRGPLWRDHEHESHRWCRLLATELGAVCDPDDRRLPAPQTPPPARDVVVVHVGAASGARRWPADRFAHVTRELASEHRVVVTGSADERRIADRVASAAELPDADVLAGRTTLDELAALVSAARLVICGDTGVAHLASAYGRPSVLLFGPTPPARWGPPPGGPHTVLWHGSGGGDPHAEEPDPALLRITVPEVLDAVAERLRGD